MSQGMTVSRARKAAVRTIDTTGQVEGVVSALGPKVRAARKAQGFSLQQLAARADVSAAAIHKIERNDMVPTITTLLKISAALERPVTDFITDSADTPERVSFIRAKERSAVETSHSGISLEGISGSYRFRGAAAIATVDAGASSGSAWMSHPGEELIYVLSGALSFTVAGEQYTLRNGDALHFEGDLPHKWSNGGRSPVRAVWFATRDNEDGLSAITGVHRHEIA